MTRLQRADWLRAAQRTLVTHGLAGVRIEALARDLGVSKGSFYWPLPTGPHSWRRSSPRGSPRATG